MSSSVESISFGILASFSMSIMVVYTGVDSMFHSINHNTCVYHDITQILTSTLYFRLHTQLGSFIDIGIDQFFTICISTTCPSSLLSSCVWWPWLYPATGLRTNQPLTSLTRSWAAGLTLAARPRGGSGSEEDNTTAASSTVCAPRFLCSGQKVHPVFFLAGVG